MDYSCAGRQLFTSIDLSALYARTNHVASDVLEVKNKVKGILRAGTVIRVTPDEMVSSVA